MINILIGWLKAFSSSRGRLYIFFGAVSVIVLGITLLLALKLSPWLYAMNVHVRLHMQLPAETKINVCWDKTRIQCLPLVPYLSTEKRVAEVGEIADLWLSELPPRPAYAVSLIFKSRGVKGTFQDLELDSWPNMLWGSIPGAGVQNIKIGVDQFKTTDVAYTMRDGLYYFEGSPGSHLMATPEIKPGPSDINNGTTTLAIWGLLFSIYLLFALPLFMLPFAMQNLGNATKNIRMPHYPWWVYGFCGLAIVVMLLLVINSPISFDAYDPMFYLQLATRKDWFNPARPQGYQLFLALIFRLSHYNLSEVGLAQALLLAVSATTCIWALRKWLHPLIAVVVIFLILLSPAQIHWALSIMRESLFVSLVLLGVTAAIAHFTTSNKLVANIWLAFFTLICGLALFVRENGILMPVVLLPALFLEGLKRLKSPGAIWKRIQAVFFLFIRYAIPVFATCIVYIALSMNNYLTYRYFQFTLHVTSHHFLWRELGTASFDARSLLQPDASMSKEAKTFLGQTLFRSFILAREETPGLDPIFMSLFPTVNQARAQRGESVNWFHSASILDEIGRSANTLMPWQANLVGVLRQYREFLVSNPSDAGGYLPRLDDSAGLEQKQQLLSHLEKTVHYQGKPIEPDSFIDIYYDVTEEYGWYRPLFILALLFSLYLLRYDDPVFLAPMAFFIANALLMIMLRTEQARYIECMDALLILQVALGLSCFIYRRFSVASQKELEKPPIKN